MKEIVKLYKVLILCICFEITTIATQCLLWKESIIALLYICLGVVAYMCYMYKNLYIQLFAGLLVFSFEFIIFLFQPKIIGVVNSLFDSYITNRNIIDNILTCLMIQFIAFILSIITSLLRRYKNIKYNNSEKKS